MDWGKIIETVLLSILPLLAAQVVALLFAWIKKIWADIKASKPNLAYWLEAGAHIAVKAAEQGGIAGYVEDKKQYAIEYLEKFMAEKGLVVDVDLIVGAVEAAVLDVFKDGREQKAEG